MKVEAEKPDYNLYEKMRSKRGLSHYRVSKITGIPQSTFSKWKTGESFPKYPKIRLLAAYFNIEADEFYKN